MSHPTPCSPLQKRARNDENCGSPSVLRTPRDPFRSPLAPRQPHFNFDITTPVSSESSQHRVYKFISTPDTFTPKPRKKPRVAQDVSPNSRQRLYDEWKERNRAVVQRQRQVEEEHQKQEKTSRIDKALRAIRATGFPTFRHFLEDFLTAHDPSQASQISQLIQNHGPHLYGLGRQWQPKIIDDWVISSHRELVSVQCAALAEHFRPAQFSKVTDILHGFSLKQYIADAERVAPLICQILRQIGIPDGSSNSKSKNRELILATTLCMLARGGGVSQGTRFRI